MHFPESREIWSFGSGYGGNALLGKKCFALRIASTMARDEGWMAEHMLIVGAESPEGEKTYVAAAFPSACGKTNFAMLIPPGGFDGWKISTVGDDIAWIRPDATWPASRHQSGSRLLRCCPWHVDEDQSERDGSARQEHHLHQCCADSRGWRVVGGDDRRASRGVHGLAGQALDSGDCQGDRRRRSAPEFALHNASLAMPDHRSRLGKSRTECRSAPSSSADAARPRCLWSTRRSTGARGFMPARPWVPRRRPLPLGPSVQVRRDPMAMLPFCGYHMGDYFRHWLQMGRNLSVKPRIFHVNWFRKGRKRLSVARLRGQHAGSEMDHRRVHGRHSARKQRSAGFPGMRTWIGRV